MNERTVFIPGVPAPQGSKRHVGRGVLVESSKALPAWREAIVYGLRDSGWHEQPWQGPVSVWLRFTFPRLVAHLRANGEVKPSAPLYKTTAPDLDKLARAVFDGLQSAGVVRDDAQIVHTNALKVFGAVPGVTVRLVDVREVENDAG